MDQQHQRRREASSSDPFKIYALPAAKFGGACGGLGFLTGGFAGIVQGVPNGFTYAVACSVQPMILGTAFSFCRTTIVRESTLRNGELSPNELIKASAIAGGVSAVLVGLVTRGRSHVIPGGIAFSMFAAGGQYFYNGWTAPRPLDDPAKKGFWKRLSENNWSPVKLLNDKEHANLLREKLLNVEVEIALIDDKIAALKAQESKSES
jgi:hypothetical protein